MQKKVIPILMVIMMFALSGIIFIQYLWIRKSISERQELIDTNVLQAIAHVENHLSDRGALAFFSEGDHFDYTLTDSLIFLEDSLGELPPMLVQSDTHWETPATMEVQVMSTHQKNGDSLLISRTQVFNHPSKADSVRVELAQIENELMRLEEVRTVFDHIRFEVNPLSDDFRLDSVRLDHQLKKELRSFKLDTLVNWGVFDVVENRFTIQPKTETTFTYEVPLFKNDVIHPGRYILKLQLNNNTELIWADILLMVFMSVIFVLIILSAFLFSVRLIIKHKKISQIKSDFINNMTHEFKTPLASISLAADSIIHPNVIIDQKRIGEYVSIIKKEKSNLNQNVERILEVAALEKDALALPIESINLTDLIQKTVQTLQLLIQSKNGHVRLNLADSIKITGSSFHLAQALSNIIENSIKYSPEKPKLQISLSQKNQMAEIEIIDQGLGMTKEQLSKVFDSFYRAETGNIHNTKGFGLGLTYAKFVIEKMNGKIQINSESGKGTRVHIQFPVS